MEIDMDAIRFAELKGNTPDKFKFILADRLKSTPPIIYTAILDSKFERFNITWNAGDRTQYNNKSAYKAVKNGDWIIQTDEGVIPNGN